MGRIFIWSYLNIENVFFHLKSQKILWNEFSDLKGKRLLKAKGYSYGKLLDQALKADIFASLHETDDDLQAM